MSHLGTVLTHLKLLFWINQMSMSQLLTFHTIFNLPGKIPSWHTSENNKVLKQNRSTPVPHLGRRKSRPFSKCLFLYDKFHYNFDLFIQCWRPQKGCPLFSLRSFDWSLFFFFMSPSKICWKPIYFSESHLEMGNLLKGHHLNMYLPQK